MSQKLPAEADAEQRDLAAERGLDETKLIDQERIGARLIDIVFAAVNDSAGYPGVDRRDRLPGRGTAPDQPIALRGEPSRGAIILLLRIMGDKDHASFG